MEDGTAEDYAALTDNFNQHVRDSLVDHLFALLRAMQGPRFGYQVDRYRHSLQSGTRALRNGEDVEMVVAALLHDVGDVVAPANHSAVAADVLRPYVSDRTHWVIGTTACSKATTTSTTSAATGTPGRRSGTMSGSTTVPPSATSTTRTASTPTTTTWTSRSSGRWSRRSSAGPAASPWWTWPRAPAPP